MIFDAALQINSNQDRKWRRMGVVAGIYKEIYFEKNVRGVYESVNLPYSSIKIALDDPSIVVTVRSPGGETPPFPQHSLSVE